MIELKKYNFDVNFNVNNCVMWFQYVILTVEIYYRKEKNNEGFTLKIGNWWSRKTNGSNHSLERVYRDCGTFRIRFW